MIFTPLAATRTAIFTSILAVASLPARSADLAAPIVTGSVSDQGSTIVGFSVTEPGSYSAGTATVDITLLPLPSISATASETGGFATSGGRIFFNFGVSGPDGGPVPVFLAVNLHATATDTGFTTSGNAQVQAAGGFSTGTTVQVSCAHSSEASSCSNNSYNDMIPLLLAPNDFSSNYVILDASATATDGQATAYADPMIFIDPTFANAGQYTIELSPGVGNGEAGPSSSNAPEPGTASLLGGAVLGVVACFRRRRERTA